MDTLYLQELKYWSTMSFFDGYPPDNDAQLSSPVYTTRGVTIDNNNNLANENNKTCWKFKFAFLHFSITMSNLSSRKGLKGPNHEKNLTNPLHAKFQIFFQY